MWRDGMKKPAIRFRNRSFLFLYEIKKNKKFKQQCDILQFDRTVLYYSGFNCKVCTVAP